MLRHWIVHTGRALCLGACFTGGSAMALNPPPAPLQVYAAGSLREPFTEIAKAYEAHTGRKTELTFGASGLLRERIEKGEAAQVFASADTQHPEKLAASGTGWLPSTLFVRNALCALKAPTVNTSTDTLLQTLLDPTVRLGTSTPKNDPSGDYTWDLFHKAEALKPGAFAALDAKAIKLTGFADAPKPPPGRGTYAWLMDEGRADIFLTYCTNARSASQEVPRLGVVELPAALKVSAAYGLTARAGDAAAAQFTQYLLSPPARAIFDRFGFGAP